MIGTGIDDQVSRQKRVQCPAFSLLFTSSHRGNASSVAAPLRRAAISAADFDGVMVPGGYAPDHIRRHARANQFVKEMNAQGKLVASICHGPWVLCSAGILRGRRATCFFAIKDDVVNAGARYEDAEVVVDQNLVTSRKPDDLPAFCRAALRVLIEAPVLAG